MTKDFLEEHFVKGAKECSSPEDILNWYRNLYYKESENTERRIVAEAINEFFDTEKQAITEIKNYLNNLISKGAIKEYVEE